MLFPLRGGIIDRQSSCPLPDISKFMAFNFQSFQGEWGEGELSK